MKLGILAIATLLMTSVVAPANAQQEVCIVDSYNQVVCGRPATDRDLRRYDRQGRGYNRDDRYDRQGRRNGDSRFDRQRIDSRIVNAGGKCIDAPVEGNNRNGTKLQLWDCNGSSSQRWSYDGYDGAINSPGGKCLDAGGSGNGAPLQLWDCNGSRNQRWNITNNGTISGIGNLCIDAAVEGNNQNGTRLQLWSCRGGSQQQWSLRN